MARTKPGLIFIGIGLFLAPLFVSADTLGQTVKFYIDPSYDLENREEISATLRIIGSKLYFYIDDSWWNKLEFKEQEKINQALNDLSQEFDNKIYPILTSTFGSEWKPGIDNDNRITVLIHPMLEGVGGYFNSGDEYPRDLVPNSNQREMVYLNSRHLDNPRAKSFLAHEFTHLITFNQKEKTYGISEEIWLNEARAEYAPTLLGYDDVYEDSNLQQRVKDFLERPSDSLTEWRNKKADYGIVNLFIQYLVDHYGKEILTNSIFSDKVGIPSLNEALKKKGFKENFSHIFENWSIAVLVNDCSMGNQYCYKNPNLKNLKVIPQLNFLPLVGESSLSFTNASYDWSANWYKIVGGKGKLVLEFDGQDEGKFSLNFLLCDFQERCRVQNLPLNEKQEGKVILPEFSRDYQSLIIIPTIQTKLSDFEGVQPTYLFSWKISAVEKTEEEKEAEFRETLLVQIEFLKQEIAKVQAQIAVILVKRKMRKMGSTLFSCQKLESNLYYGMRNSSEVRCLQEFLKAQGPEIYPEGLVTGNFLTLTKAAVIRFQEKYASETLAPWGLTKGTGFVGPITRAEINQILGR